MTATAVFWDRIAESYAAQPLPNPEATDRKLSVIRSLTRPDHRLLDFGCGTGTIALRLRDAVNEVHGLDLSSAMIRIARDKATEAGADDAHFHVGTLDGQLDLFDDASFDGVLAFNIVHLVPDVDATLKQIFHLLRPGGYFVQSTAFMSAMTIPLGLALPVMRLFNRAPDHVGMLNKRAVIEQLQDIGFVDTEEHDVGTGRFNAFLVSRKP